MAFVWELNGKLTKVLGIVYDVDHRINNRHFYISHLRDFI